MSGLTYQIQFDSNLKEAFSEINQTVNQTTEGVKNLGKQFKTLVAFEVLGNVSNALQGMKAGLDNMIAPGAALNANMAELSAITGVTGDKLKEIEDNARDTAMSFGLNASGSVESYKVILSKLGPELAKNSTALKAMGDSVAVTSKLMGGDSLAATQVLTTAMNQFGVSLTDPIAASRTMAEMMNVMAASAKEGSAELPQIKEALEQVGMVAKSAGVSFSETNAAIQVLDKAGKQGAEGGVALRNMLSILGEGRFTAPKTADALKAYGISVTELGNHHLTLTQRLNLLKPALHDTALMTQVFGRENQAAAIALINGSSEIDRYNGLIQGTNTAYEQSETIMGSYNETMARMKAKFDDLKISIFNATQPILPFAQGMMEGTIAIGQSAQGVYALHQAFNSIKPLMEGLSFAPVITSVTSLWTSITSITAAGATGVTGIIASIPVIGWIAAAIAAIGALTFYLYENSRTFNEIINGVWAVIKYLFEGLWSFITEFFGQMWTDFKNFVALVQWVGATIFSALKAAFEGIMSVGLWLWNGFRAIFGGIADLVQSLIIAPISMAFDWLMQKIQAVVDWFRKIMKPLTDVYNEGAKEGGANYDARKAAEKAGDIIAPMGGVPGLSIPAPSASAITEKAILTADKKKKGDGDGGGGGGNSPKSITNNINKLVENVVIHTTTMEMSKEELKTFITETLMTVLNDSNLQL